MGYKLLVKGLEYSKPYCLEELREIVQKGKFRRKNNDYYLSQNRVQGKQKYNWSFNSTGFNCIGLFTCRFSSINTLLYCEYIFSSLWFSYHFLFSSLLYCKSPVCNRYSIQNLCSLTVISKASGQQQAISSQVLGKSQIVCGLLTVWWGDWCS